MRLSRKGLQAAALVLAGTAMAASAQDLNDQGKGDLLLDGVTVVSTADGSLQRNMAVLVQDGRIVRVARAGTVKADIGIRRVQARGKFVVPGYLDMHAHPLNSPTPQGALALMLAYGITGFRQMSGTPPLLAARSAGRLAFGPDAPALLATPGTVLAGPLATNPAAAVAEVDRQKAQGADFIKVVDLRPAAFNAALARATAVGLTFGGHLPPDVDVRDAARRGMRHIEHLGPNDSLLLGCSTAEAAIRAEAAAAPPQPATTVNFQAPASAVKRLVVNPMLSLPPPALARESRVLATYDDAKCRALAHDLAAAGVWQVPTLVRLRDMELADDPTLAAQPELRFVPADDRALWRDVAGEFTTRLSAADRATLKALWARQLKLTKLFDQAGVPMMAGTDLGGQWIVAGVSLHQEFDLLGQAGLSPLRVLQMTTIDGARFLHREARMGSVTAGREADLVLLDANPVAAIANLHKLFGVVRAGRYYDRAALNELKSKAASGAALSESQGGAAGGAMGDEE